MEGKARSGAQQPAIVLQSYIWPDAQSRRLIWISKSSKPSTEPICESSLLKWDLPILCKFALGLAFAGTLNQLASNLNQIARKRNMDEDLSAIQRAELNYLSSELKLIAQTIRTYLACLEKLKLAKVSEAVSDTYLKTRSGRQA